MKNSTIVLYSDYLVSESENRKNRKISRKKTEHQYRLKFSLRIEWDHSQPPKITLKYRYGNLHP